MFSLDFLLGGMVGILCLTEDVDWTLAETV